jgi:hypothetical protein
VNTTFTTIAELYPLAHDESTSFKSYKKCGGTMIHYIQQLYHQLVLRCYQTQRVQQLPHSYSNRYRFFTLVRLGYNWYF